MRTGNPNATSHQGDGTDTKTRFGQMVREARQALNWSQEQVARTIHVTRDTVARIEQGRTKPHPATRSRLLAALDLPLEGLRVGPRPAPALALLTSLNPLIPLTPIPIVNINAQRGAPVDPINSVPAALFPYPHLNLLALVAEGTAMAPVVQPGDYCIAARALRPQLREGDLVCVQLHGDEHYLLRWYHLVEGAIELASADPARHRTRRVTPGMIVVLAPVVVVVHNRYLDRQPAWRLEP